jgi:hypothetical protein
MKLIELSRFRLQIEKNISETLDSLAFQIKRIMIFVQLSLAVGSGYVFLTMHHWTADHRQL